MKPNNNKPSRIKKSSVESPVSSAKKSKRGTKRTPATRNSPRATAALSGLTRAMAVDLGGRVRVNAICPAAIHTPMLAAGFAERPDALAALHDAHPTGRIGLPEEVAHLARYLIAEAPDFLNGSCLGLDGGIAGRLHDPV